MKIGEIMSQEILVIHQAEAEKLGEPVAALIPVGEVLALYATAQDQNSEKIGAKIGIWESSPGQFRRAVKEREFSHIIQGSCIFTPDEGPSIELKAGDAVLFPANSQGVWDIKEDLRKTYCIF